MNSNSKIILLSDVYKMREEKQKELAYYSNTLLELNNKLFFIKKEIEITNFIIEMIEKEKVYMIGNEE
jgi:hypothetical protein